MTTIINEKPIAKAVVRDVLETLPDDASYDEIMRELAFERMVDRGIADVRAGRSISHDEAVQRIHSWRN